MSHGIFCPPVCEVAHQNTPIHPLQLRKPLCQMLEPRVAHQSKSLPAPELGRKLGVIGIIIFLNFISLQQLYRKGFHFLNGNSDK